jgi:hydroxymethylbilane synthase
MKIKIGTRGSKLALWQAHFVQDQLNLAGVETEIITVETKGDKILDVSIAKIGSKGVFTEEIEELLASGSIDIAVHSAKDMQSVLPAGFEIIAFAERELANDVIVSRDKSLSLKNGNFRLGTSSTRRIATLKHYYPKVEAVPVRGNLQTRIRKMDEGNCDALLLAYAGAHRMGYHDLIVEKTSLEEFTPAVGQGSVAIEVHESLVQEKKDIVRSSINHLQTENCLLAERAFLKEMDGGCSIPVFGMAILKENRLNITGGIISLNGQQRIYKSLSGSSDQPEALGTRLAKLVLSDGGKKILEAIKKASQNE